jgi:hypothetical protein
VIFLIDECLQARAGEVGPWAPSPDAGFLSAVLIVAVARRPHSKLSHIGSTTLRADATSRAQHESAVTPRIGSTHRVRSVDVRTEG